MENCKDNEKARLRAEFKRKRMAISAENRQLWSDAIRRQLLDMPVISAANIIFAYVSRPDEVDTHEIVHSILHQGKRALTPSPDIKALPHHGLFRISKHENEPGFKAEQCDESRIEEIDLIVVPGIVWDTTGARIGFGGGYFDRLLSMARRDCIKIGLAYDCQVIDEIPRDPWDEPTDYVITERRVIKTR